MVPSAKPRELSGLLTKGIFISCWGVLALTGTVSMALDLESSGRDAVAQAFKIIEIKKLLHQAAVVISICLAVVVLTDGISV